VEVEKPRLSYAQVFGVKTQLSEFSRGTLAWLTQRVIEDIAAQSGNPDVKQLGVTHMYGLKALQRMPIGQEKVSALKRSDFIEFVKWRRDQPTRQGRKVGAATAKQSLMHISGVIKYACSTWDDCEDLVPVQIHLEAASKFCGKRGLVAKANRRTRRPSDEEVALLLDYWKRHPGRVLRMPDVVAFCLASARRRGEVCRLTWGDVDFENQVYWVRDVKHPTKKKGNDKQFLLFPAIEQIIRRQPRIGTDPAERIFPFVAESITQQFIAAKKAIAEETGDPTILTLRLHDHRAEAISKWLLSGMPPEDVRLAVSGHNDTRILETVYDRRGASDLKKKYLPQPAA
jgi:integrase